MVHTGPDPELNNITVGFVKCDEMCMYLILGLFLLKEQIENPVKTGPACPVFSVLLIRTQQCKAYS